MRSIQSFAGMESLEDRKLFSAESYLSAVAGAAATDIISTKNGATFVVGSFSGTTDFAPGKAKETLKSNGASSDAFVAHYAKNGKLKWARKLGGKGLDEAQTVTRDADGNVYVITLFYAGFSVGRLGIAKFDKDGNLLLQKKFSADTSVTSKAIKVHDGDIYITGKFSGELAGLTTEGFDDNIFVMKLNDEMKVQWAHKFGNGDFQDKGVGIDVNSKGELVVVGTYSGITDFDPSPTEEFNLNGEGFRLSTFVLKLTRDNGSFISAKRLDGDSDFEVRDIVLDKNDNLYMTGAFLGTADLTTHTLTSNGDRDIFVLKLDGDNNIKVAVSTGGLGDEDANTMTVDSNGAIYLAGRFDGTADFDPDPDEEANFTATGIFPSNGFVLKLKKTAEFGFARHYRQNSPFIATGFNSIAGIALDDDGNIALAGEHTDRTDFNPGKGTQNLEHDDGAMFLTKLTKKGKLVV